MSEWPHSTTTDLWYDSQLRAKVVQANLWNVHTVYNDATRRRLDDSEQT